MTRISNNNAAASATGTARTTFGSRFSNGNANVGSMSRGGPGAEGTQREKSEFWMNIGYSTGNDKYPFVSLSKGIPLDLQDLQEETGSNEYRNFLSAQNELLKDFVNEMEALEPGDTAVFDIEGMLIGGYPVEVQLRRVRNESGPVDTTSNPLSRRNINVAADGSSEG